MLGSQDLFFALLYVTGITLLSALGILFVPFLQKRESCKVICDVVLIGIGIGTLLGDSFIHLLPEAIRADKIKDPHYSTTFNAVLFGIIMFYVADHLIMGSCNHNHSNQVAVESSHVRHCPQSLAEVEAADISHKESQTPQQKSLVAMILLGDALHNFMDGIAIGVAFSNKSPMGTLIAILLHELPHELSDYAVLINNGISKGKAAVYNMASNLTAYLGVFLVYFIGETTILSHYGNAMIAGGFIYVALTDLIPSLQKIGADSKCSKKWWILALKMIMVMFGIVLIILVHSLGHDHDHNHNHETPTVSNNASAEVHDHSGHTHHN